ncbi:MAG: hypothetical protein LBJ82_01345 [Deltaproteobacteria bacterium]|jgi:hypothetical protein|nr:hypothetical protein [Deltaproteobacteria bacterium]
MIHVPFQSREPISVGNAGPAARFRSASGFVTPGQAAGPEGLNQFAQGLNKLNNVVFSAEIERRRMQNAADLLADQNDLEDAYRDFSSRYQQENKGTSAREAEEAYGQFFQDRLNILRQKWGENEYLMADAERIWSRVRQPALRSAVAYRDQEEEEYRAQEQETARLNLLRDAADSSRPFADKVLALRDFENAAQVMAGNLLDENRQWSGGKNIEPVLIKARQDFAMETMKSLVAANRLGEARILVRKNPNLFGAMANDALIWIDARDRAAAERGEAQRRKEGALVLSNAENYLAYALETGDFSRVDEAGGKLQSLGLQKEFEALTFGAGVYRGAQELMQAGKDKPLLEQSAEVEKHFSALLREHPEQAKIVLKVRDASMDMTERRKKAFLDDPAGWAASEQSEEFPNETLRLKDSFARQEYAGRGIAGFTPKALSKAQADELNARYSFEPDARKQAEIVAGLAGEYGEYAFRAAAEAKLPPGIVAVGQVANALPPSTLTRLTAAAKAKDGDLPPLDAAMRADLENNAFLRTMREISDTMAANPQREFSQGLEKALRDFTRAGGRPEEITDKFFVAGDGNLLIVAPKGNVPPGLEDALQFKTEQLLEEVETLRSALPEGSLEEKAETRAIRSEYLNTIRDGKWVFNPEANNFLLIDPATGKTALDASWREISVSPAEIPALREKYNSNRISEWGP